MNQLIQLRRAAEAEPIVVPPNVRCHRPWSGFELFDHLGDVRPCCWGKVSCGNVNQQTPEEIWRGPGFELYRRAMKEGDVADICGSDCPILQGHYVEELAPAPEAPVAAPADVAPKFLRVVPAIRCNLRCPMCYQLGDPPPALPVDLFEQLTPWMRRAQELLVLGGETFLARECLSWIERASPDVFPELDLAAITNGLFFSSAVTELIAARRWSWILVSIDAATAPTFRRVRGGSFAELTRSLDRLAAVRRRMPPFELRFGFTLQRGNLADAERFLDLCDRYDAMPQFTTVVGDWHKEGPRHHRDYALFTAALEVVEKQLWASGFSDRLIMGAIARLQRYRYRKYPAMPLHREIHVPASEIGERQWRLGVDYHHAEAERRVLVGHGDFGDQPWLEGALAISAAPVEVAGSLALRPWSTPVPRHVRLEVSSDADADALGPVFEILEAQMAATPDEARLLTVVANGAVARHAGVIADWARRQRIRAYRIELPHADGEDGAAPVPRHVPRTIRKRFASRAIKFLGGVARVDALGLVPADQFAEPRVAYERRRHPRVGLTILSPAYNLAGVIDQFVTSVGAQGPLDVPCELILVDDGSSDDTLERAVTSVARLPEALDALVLSLPRQEPYRSGTFSFRAGLARQAGLLHARGGRVLFVDADQRLDPECAGVHMRMGRYFDVVLGHREFEGEPAVETSHWLELRHQNVSGRRDWWTSFYTGNASVRRDVLIAAGGFDETLQFWGLDDTDLGYRLARSGASVWHTLRARVEHVAGVSSGGGATMEERRRAWRIHRDVLYRKYLDDGILRAFAFLDEPQ